MDIKNPNSIKQTAASCLGAASYNPRRLVLIHSGIAFAFTLLLTLINFIVNRQIAGTGGLSGMGLRSILSTVQMVLQYASTLLMPFWQIGFAAAALAMARKESFGPKIVTKGFQRFPSVLGMLVAEGVVTIAVAFACVYLCSAVFMFTPMAQPFMEILTPALEDSTILSGGTIYLDDATLNAAMGAMTPVLIMFVVLYLVVMIPVSYHFRMADFILMDKARCGGLRALVTSVKITRRHCIDLFKLDLRFWLFYVLQVLATLVGYVDMILPTLGIELPMETDMAFFLFYILYIVAQLALFVWAKPMVQTSYALFYDGLQEVPDRKEERPEPKKLPWDYQ